MTNVRINAQLEDKLGKRHREKTELEQAFIVKMETNEDI